MGKEQSKAARRISLAVSFFNRIGSIKKRVNRRMEGKYSPSLIAMSVSAAAALLMVIILFLPNYLGVADDGSLSRVMNSAGVYYIQNEISDNYNNYFVKTYSNVLSGYYQRDDMLNSQVIIVKAAVWLDNLITRDKFFDIRFLALIYACFYVPAVYLLIKQACMRVKNFSEGIAIGIAGLLIFADVAYITYFNSFYPEAVWFISLMYCVGAAISFQEARSGYKDFAYLVLLCVSGVFLITSRNQCAFIGILLALYSLKLLFCRRNWLWGVICVLAGLVLGFLSIACMVQMQSDFNETSKFHAMTRGVLFGSDNPAETLKEFGIESSYEMLTDVSGYDYLPFVQPGNEALKDGFLDRYTVTDVGIYYLRHPGKFIGMVDVAIKSCFGIRRDYCGNYEKSVGLPARAKSIFWSMWSTFKNNSAPKTIGYLIVLIGAVCLLFGRGYSLRPVEDRRNTIFIDSMLVLVFICFTQAGITIINSGDAEMVQHCFLISYCIDIITFFVFAELVHKINIF